MKNGTASKNLVSRVLACGVLFFVLCGYSSAQQQGFRQYGAAEGLANLNVRCMLQDQTGFLWVGTDNGLFRFEGSTFTQYGHPDGLPSTEIYALGQSPSTGQFWVATAAGLARFEHGRFLPFPLDSGRNASQVRQIAFDDAGAMYVVDAAGIHRRVLDARGGDGFKTVAPGNVRGFFLTGDGAYFGRDSDLWRLQNGQAQAIGRRSGLPAEQWDAIALDSGGSLWVRSRTKLYELPARQMSFVDRSAGVPHAVEPRLAADRHGGMYVSTLSGAVEFEGRSVTFLDPDHGMPAGTVSPILVDRDDSLWMGMTGGGLVRRLGHGEWASWKHENGLPHNSVWAIEPVEGGRAWVGTSGGLTLMGADGKVQRSWTMKTGLPSDRVLAIERAPSGDIFVGTDPHGLTQFSSSGRLIRTYGAADGFHERVTAMAVDPRGKLWVIGNEGVFEADSVAPVSGARLRFTRFSVPDVNDRTAFRDILITEQGTVWVATSRGLRRFQNGAWRAYTTADGLDSDDLDAIAERQGSLWVAYRDALGMTRFDIHGDTLYAHHVGTGDGLSSDDVYALAFDDLGQLWANTDKGVDVLASGRWKHFSSQDGLVWDDTNSHALAVDDTERIWIGTSGGLSRYSPSAYVPPVRPATTVLTSIRGEIHAWRPDESPVLPYKQRTLSLQFAALNFTDEHPRFRYRLRGFDDRWIETAEHTVHFAALSPGQYTFEVEAADSDQQWSVSPATFSFSIQSPWWAQWPFIAVASVLAVLLMRFLWLLRVRQLLAQRTRLQRVVDEKTAELRESHRQLETIAYIDQLTSLPNRRKFHEEFRIRLHAARQTGSPCALLLIDLDFFKVVNDTFGHDAGDAVLSEFGTRLRAAVRAIDFVARLGGDEFAVLLGGDLDAEIVQSICQRITEHCSEPMVFGQHFLQIGCSIGVGLLRDGQEEDALYKAADLALYESKRRSRTPPANAGPRVDGEMYAGHVPSDEYTS